MKAVVWHGVGDIRLDDVPDPLIKEATDAVVRITQSAICGTDLHMIRGTMSGMIAGTVLGHEAVGVVEAVGDKVRNFSVGDRVVIPSTVGCGSCAYCARGLFAQCDNANPNGPNAGTAFFGGPQPTGPLDGLQAEYARVPHAAATLVRIPDSVTDEQAILLSDIFPTGWFGAKLADVKPGDSVLVLGAGAVGQFAIASAKRQGAARVFVVDGIGSRLDIARSQNAETIDFNSEDPVEVIKDLTFGRGVGAVIDAVGIDAQSPADQGDAGEAAAEEANPDGDLWVPGDKPSQATQWAVGAVAKAGRIGLIGVYAPGFTSFPIGDAFNKNLTIKMGDCNHRHYVPQLLDLVSTGVVDPTALITQKEELPTAIEAYESFDRREDGWLKTVLQVS